MKIIIAVPQTTLRLFEVESNFEGKVTKEEMLKDFKENVFPDHITETYIGTCKVGEYRDRATILAEVPTEIKPE